MNPRYPRSPRLRPSLVVAGIVLLDFWTTWCTPCLAEMPSLALLQQDCVGELVVLGFSLDFVPDSHGHVGGHDCGEAGQHSHARYGEYYAHAAERVRRKVEDVAQSRGVNYPILLDERNHVGGQFNGGELPTTVIIDAEGLIRRGFVGVRSPEVLSAMVQEAQTVLTVRRE